VQSRQHCSRVNGNDAGTISRNRELYQAALELAPRDRAGFLDNACPGDEALRLEVEKLIVDHDQGGNLLARPILEPQRECL
jgi:hypothetical protein